MAKTEVVDRSGSRWVIRRRWTPRWTRVDAGKRFRQFHRRKGDSANNFASPKNPENAKKDRSSWWELLDIPGDIDALVVVVAIVAILLLLWFAVIPLLLIAFDAILVFLLFVAGVVARVFLRRPWIIVATRIDGAEIQREVVGWRASRNEIASLRQQIEAGSIALPSSFEPPSPWSAPEP